LLVATRMTTRTLTLVLVAGCMHGGIVTPPPQEPAAEPPAAEPSPPATDEVNAAAVDSTPAADSRPSGQQYVDGLEALGYKCASWKCWSARVSQDPLALSNWQVVISYDATATGPTWPVWIQSAAYRPFGAKCADFARYLPDLVDAANNFHVTCDDTSQQFLMWTEVDLQDNWTPAWGQSWLEQHVANRAAAYKLLSSAGAIRR
jgi:hypothetical protein